MAEESQSKRRKKSPMTRVINVVAGFHVACVCLLLLGILTWLGTLEQADRF